MGGFFSKSSVSVSFCIASGCECSNRLVTYYIIPIIVRPGYMTKAVVTVTTFETVQGGKERDGQVGSSGIIMTHKN